MEPCNKATSRLHVSDGLEIEALVSHTVVGLTVRSVDGSRLCKFGRPCFDAFLQPYRP